MAMGANELLVSTHMLLLVQLSLPGEHLITACI
jgi:hypothetical protein